MQRAHAAKAFVGGFPHERHRGARSEAAKSSQDDDLGIRPALKVPSGRWRIRKGAWLWVSRSLYVARAVQEAIASCNRRI